MKLIIVGAGDVGGYLAQYLSHDNELTVVDPNSARLAELADKLDIGTMQGSGTLETVLARCGAEKADYLIAATNIDEINAISCMAAGRLGVKHRIARIRDAELASEVRRLNQATLTVNPEKAAVRAILDLLIHSGTKDYLELDGDQIRLISLDVVKGGPLIGRSLLKIAQKFDNLDFRIVARVSEGVTSIPSASDILEAGDIVTFAVRSRQSLELFRITGTRDVQCKNVMILGAGQIALAVARDLERLGGTNVKLFTVPNDTSLSEYDLAEMLPNTSIFVLDGKEIDAMAAESLGDMDALLSLSEDEEKNIITGLVAKHLGVNRTITLVQKTDYMPIIKTIGLDVGINKRIIAAQEILKFIKRGRLREQHILSGSGALVATFSVGPETEIAGKALSEITLPVQALFGSISRNGVAFVPTGNNTIEVGDEATLITLEENLPALERFFE
jgi:trk system potassium uptake protein